MSLVMLHSINSNLGKRSKTPARPTMCLREAITAVLVVVVLLSLPLYAANPPAWTRPFPPFHIAGNLYYVGSEDLAVSSA